MSSLRTVAAGVVAIALLASARVPAASGDAAGSQIGAGFSSRWADGETWTRYHEHIDRTEVGLGLVPSGKGGTALISFAAQWTGRMPVGGPEEILVFAAPPANVDPNLLRTAGLVLVVDMKFPRQAVFDWTQRLAVDQPGPGGQPTTGIARINQAELARLGRATTLSATIFAIDVEFKTSQRQALRHFAEKISSR